MASAASPRAFLTWEGTLSIVILTRRTFDKPTTMKMNRNLLALGAASVVAVASVNAQEEISVTTTFAWESAYVFRGVQLAEHAYMPSVDVTYGSGYFGVWAAMPVQKDDSNEVDFYAGYNFEIENGLTLDVGLTYYTYPDQAKKTFDNDFNTVEAYIGTTFSGFLNPSVYLYHDFDLESYTLELSGGHSIELVERTTLDFGGAIGWSDADRSDDYVYFLASAGIGYAINDYVSSSFYVNYSVSSENYMFGYNDDDKLWVGLSITGGF